MTKRYVWEPRYRLTEPAREPRYTTTRMPLADGSSYKCPVVLPAGWRQIDPIDTLLAPPTMAVCSTCGLEYEGPQEAPEFCECGAGL